MLNELIKVALIATLWFVLVGLNYAVAFVGAYGIFKMIMVGVRKVYRVHYTKGLIQSGYFYKTA